MSVTILSLLIIMLGIAAALKLSAVTAQRLILAFVAALLLGLVGCAGSLSWLNAETSGRANWASDTNPYLFAAMFGLSTILATTTAFLALALFLKKRSERPR